MKAFIDKLLNSYKKNEWMKNAIEYEVGISDKFLEQLSNNDY